MDVPPLWKNSSFVCLLIHVLIPCTRTPPNIITADALLHPFTHKICGSESWYYLPLCHLISNFHHVLAVIFLSLFIFYWYFWLRKFSSWVTKKVRLAVPYYSLELICKALMKNPIPLFHSHQALTIDYWIQYYLNFKSFLNLWFKNIYHDLKRGIPSYTMCTWVYPVLQRRISIPGCYCFYHHLVSTPKPQSI